MNRLRGLLALCLVGGVLAAKEPAKAAPAAAAAKDGAGAAEAGPSQARLLPLISMEQAFVRALQKRNALAGMIAQQRSRMQGLKGAELEKAARELEQLKKTLAQRVAYMDAIYRLDGARSYEYNPVTSTIYLRVGTVAEVFGRAVQTRDLLARRALELDRQMEAEKDAAKKAELKKQYDAAASRWALMVNALFDVFQVHPKRQYEYNPASSVLFLKSTDAEVRKLQADLDNARRTPEPKAEPKAKAKAKAG